jgi:hypothetical protein
MDQPIYFRISPEMRKCAYYVLASAVPLALVCFCISRFVRNENIVPATLRSMLPFTLCMTMVVPIRWSLRIDDQGIARRFLFCWDLWPWDIISSGRIEKRHPYTLLDPKRPWWRRKLSFGYMSAKDISRTMELINTYYRLPAAPPLPDELVIKYGNFIRKLARFNAQGILIQGTKAYLWSEVCRLHITRMDRLRRDFQCLEIVLPDLHVELTLISTQYGTNHNWRGASAEIINEFLERYAPADRIDKDVVGELPAKRIDVEKQLAKAIEKRRIPRLMLLVMVLCVPIFIWMAIAQSVWKALFVGVWYTAIMLPLYFFCKREIQSHCQKLERQLAVFDQSDTETSTITS